MTEFSTKVVEEAWERSGGSCECVHPAHGHQHQCGKNLLKAYRGSQFSFFGWEAHSKSGMYLDDMSDIEILCWDPCYISILKAENSPIKANNDTIK